MMRKVSLFVVIVSAILFCSCNGGEKNKKGKLTGQELLDSLLKPKMEVNGNDTVEVMALANHFLDLLREENINDAVAMLYYLNGDSIESLPLALERQEKVLLNRLRGSKSYDIRRLVFNTEKDSEVECVVTLRDSRPGVRGGNTTRFFLKPVRRDGAWYLTVADTMSDSNMMRGTQIEN